MNGDNEIAALVRLLDDPDENIFDQIKEKLMEIGPECIPSLEKARFEDNYGDLFISRTEHLIHDIGFGTLKKLHEKFPEIPSDPREQNQLWYNIYEKRKDDKTIRDTHKNFLLLREITGLSFLFLIVLYQKIS